MSYLHGRSFGYYAWERPENAYGPRTANRASGQCVAELQPFKGSNLYGIMSGGLPGPDNDDKYIVYSYGPHFPLALHTRGRWFINQEKYSRSTARQKSYACFRIDGELVSTDFLRAVIDHGGLAGAVDHRITQGATA